jgi:hypothetical protein
VLAVVAVVVFLVVSNSSTSPSSLGNTSSTSTTAYVPPPTTATPASQGAELTRLLQSGPQDRSALQNAIDVIEQSINSGRGCGAGVLGAVTEIQAVAAGRETLLAQLSTTSLSAVPNGNLVLNNLKSAWQISGRIDRAFEQWASVEENNNCQLSDANVASYHTTAVLDPISTSIKTQFVDRWNPIARQLNQPSNWSADQI